jgi:hypothetical protein
MAFVIRALDISLHGIADTTSAYGEALRDLLIVEEAAVAGRSSPDWKMRNMSGR